jgi:ribosomal protein S12 methylthiotransferase accessory factor
MEMIINFPGGLKVDANFGPYTVETDQPDRSGKPGEAPTPFAIFLASIGTCAGIYVLGFCKQRGLSSEGIQIRQKMHNNRFTGMVGKIDLEIELPPEFPEKYHSALIRSAEQCAVKKHFENPPEFEISTKVTEPATV